MKRYPKIRYPNDDESRGLLANGDIIIQEKLDGANTRFTHEQNLDEEYQTSTRNIVFGSRNVQYKNKEDERNQFERPINYIRKNVNPDKILKLEDEHEGSLTFFGESMTPHTLEYDWENSPAFIGFDIYHEDDGRWLTHTEMKRAFEQLGLEVAPIIDIVNYEAWDDYSLEVPTSSYGDVTAEGVTIKNYETQTFCKWVREGFKEKMGQTSGKSKKQQTTGAEKLSHQKITNARIEKVALKMIDEGPYDSLQMEMMQPTDEIMGLPQLVIKDMAEEEAVDVFLNERWEVDIGEFRSITASRCAQVLKNMINKRSIEETNKQI